MEPQEATSFYELIGGHATFVRLVDAFYAGVADDDLLRPMLITAFVLGVCLHVVLYGPTAMLPPVWRNLARYVSGVAAVLAIMAIALLLAPGLTVWEAFGIQAGLFAMCGLGVAAGYLIAGD